MSHGEAEADSADKEFVAAHLIPPRLRRLANLGYIADAKIERAHDLFSAFHEAEDTVRQLQLRRSVSAFRNTNTDDPAPVRGEPCRVRALHLDADNGLRDILADVLLPVWACRRIGAEHVVAAVGVIELDEGGAAIAR